MKPNEELNEWHDMDIIHLAQMPTTYPNNWGFSVWSKHDTTTLLVNPCIHLHGVDLNAHVAPAWITRSFNFCSKIVQGK